MPFQPYRIHEIGRIRTYIRRKRQHFYLGSMHVIFEHDILLPAIEHCLRTMYLTISLFVTRRMCIFTVLNDKTTIILFCSNQTRVNENRVKIVTSRIILSCAFGRKNIAKLINIMTMGRCVTTSQ